MRPWWDDYQRSEIDYSQKRLQRGRFFIGYASMTTRFPGLNYHCKKTFDQTPADITPRNSMASAPDHFTMHTRLSHSKRGLAQQDRFRQMGSFYLVPYPGRIMVQAIAAEKTLQCDSVHYRIRNTVWGGDGIRSVAPYPVPLFRCRRYRSRRCRRYRRRDFQLGQVYKKIDPCRNRGRNQN